MRVIEFIGTAPSTAGCGTDQDLTRCGVDYWLGPGTVSVSVEEPGGPPMLDDAFERADDPPPGSTVVLIDGVPALLTREADSVDPTATRALVLRVPAPDHIFGVTRLRAEVRGPGEDLLLDQIEDLFASVHYEPALTATDLMDAGAAATAARKTIDRIADGPGFACFPRVPGRSRRAVVRWLLGSYRLDRRLPVTCSTAIEGTPLELWRMTLTSSWTKGPGRSAGSMAETVWIGLDGEYMTIRRSGDPPYWP
jgi:hypothetical protein